MGEEGGGTMTNEKGLDADAERAPPTAAPQPGDRGEGKA